MKKLLWLLIPIILILIQFKRIDKTNPPIDNTKDLLSMTKAPQEIQKLIKGACYDCHANTTVYPWYTNVAPVSWWIRGHIDNARGNVNFSEWGTYEASRQKNSARESAEVIEQKKMPAFTYSLMHKEAKLTDDQREILAKWFKSQM